MIAEVVTTSAPRVLVFRRCSDGLAPLFGSAFSSLDHLVPRLNEWHAIQISFRELPLLLEAVDKLMAQTLFHGHFDLRALLVGELKFREMCHVDCSLNGCVSRACIHLVKRAPEYLDTWPSKGGPISKIRPLDRCGRVGHNLFRFVSFSRHL